MYEFESLYQAKDLQDAISALAADPQAVVIAVDEYEAIRLIDYEGLSQEECAASMGVARTTVQQIYNTAREKLSTALVGGRPFLIQGGDYRLCQGDESCRGCCRRSGGAGEGGCPWRKD